MVKDGFKSILVLAAIAVLAGLTAAQTVAPPVDVSLSLADGKRVYRMGEPITLVLSFTSFRDGFSADTEVYGADTYLDKITVTPDQGVINWRKEFMGVENESTDVSSPQTLSSQPTIVKLTLNNSFRFDAPGTYRVSVKTKRASDRDYRDGKFTEPLDLTTNSVVFEIKPMTDAEEVAEVARLTTAIDASKDTAEQVRLAEQLSFLSGDASTTEKVKRYLSNGDGKIANYSGSIRMGLYISRNKPLVRKLLENAFNDPGRVVDRDLLAMVSYMKGLEAMAGAGKRLKPHNSGFAMDEPRDVEPELSDANNYYLKQLVASLPSRNGRNLTTAAQAILLTLPRKYPDPQMVATVRSILIKNFDVMDIFDREYLLSAKWDVLKDPALIPSLELMLSEKSVADYNVHSTVLKRLDELNPARAKPSLISDIKSPALLLQDEVIEASPAGPFPEVDDAIFKQITDLAPNATTGHDMVFLRYRALLAARFASPAIYDGLLDLFKKYASEWQADSRGILLGYFMRYRPTEALALVERELGSMREDTVGLNLYNVFRFNCPDEALEFLRKRLASSDPHVASSGAYLLGLHGVEKDRALIKARLDRWVSEWGERPFELEGPQMKKGAEGQAMLQVELMLALRTGKAWKISDDEFNDVRANCLTDICHQNFPPKKQP